MNRLYDLFPPRIAYWLREYAGFPIVFGGVALVIAAIAYFGDFSKVVETKFLRAEVIGTSDSSSDNRYSVDATIRLPDGNLTVVRARTFRQAQWFMDDICVSKSTTQAGGTRYKLQDPTSCLGHK